MATSLDKYMPCDPSFSVVPPGGCQFDEEWTTCKVTKKQQCSFDTQVITFDLPCKTKPLNLPTCACILAMGGKGNDDDKPFIRPYTPVSTNSMVGEFEVMVKIYEKGNLSRFMGGLKVGDEMAFKHIAPNVKKQYPFNKRHVGMLVGGTGITPMVQALHAILGNPADDTKVSMLYGSQTAEHILAGETLKSWSNKYSEQFSVVDVLSAEPEGSEWKGQRGFINKALIEKFMPEPETSPLIFVCGPPAMYNALCGPRDQPELTGLLAEMGYTADMVYKF